MVIIKGYNADGVLVHEALLLLSYYNKDRIGHEDDARDNGAVRVVIDIAL